MGRVTKQRPPELPAPPDIQRQVHIRPYQMVGMGLILILPLLGLLGLTDTRLSTRRAEAAGIELQVRYPHRFRHENGEPMEIRVENTSRSEIPKLHVKLGRSYLDAFHNVQFAPEPKEVDRDWIIFEFDMVGIGEQRRVEIEMEASSPGSRAAAVEAGPKNGAMARVTFATFVLP